MKRTADAGASFASGPGRSHELFYGMVGTSATIQAVFQQISQFGDSSIPVLILGDTGTGKDLAARAIWQIWRPERPFVAVSCAAIPQTLIESELFGHEQGAFTGAVRRRDGLLSQADGGILFLDEIAELPLEAQAALLRAVETGEYRRLGGGQTLHARFRVVAATHRDLDSWAEEGRFRHDLLYRLGSARIVIPPLRHRLEDIPVLASHFLSRFWKMNRKGQSGKLSPEAVQLLLRSSWPGNVRQLKNAIEAAATLTDGSTIETQDLAGFLQLNRTEMAALGGSSPWPAPLASRLESAEALAIRHALRLANDDIETAATILDISRATLYRRIALLRKGGHPLRESQT